MKSAKMCL